MVRIDGDGEHFGDDAAIEALDHAIGLWRTWLDMAIRCPKLGTNLGKGPGEAATVVCQYICHVEGQGSGRFAQESDGTGFGFIVLDGEMDRARAAVDGDVEIALAPLAIASLQLGQVLDIDVHEAEVIVLEAALAFGGLCRCRLEPAVEALGLEDAPDAVAVEMGQEMCNDKRQVIEREVGDPTQRADNRALRLGCLPGHLVWPRRMVLAVCHAPLAPLADGLGGDAIALSEDAAALMGAGDLGPGDGRGAGVRMDLQHRSDLPLAGLDQTFKQVAIRGNSMPHRVPTMFRDLTVSPTRFSLTGAASNCGAPRKDLCAAPPSEKRCTLSRVKRAGPGSGHGRRISGSPAQFVTIRGPMSVPDERYVPQTDPLPTPMAVARHPVGGRRFTVDEIGVGGARDI